MGNNGAILQAVAAQAAQPQQQFNIAQPMNDNQLVCLMAAMMSAQFTPEEAVARSMDIVVEAVVQGPQLVKRIQARMKLKT